MTPPDSTTTTASTSSTASSSSSSSPATTSSGTPSQLSSSHGSTTIADAVVAKVAGLAAREVSGVYGFGGGASRAFGAISERIPGGRPSSTRGVSVEVGERQAAVDVTVVVEYGGSIVAVARSIRQNVIESVQQMTGLEVVEVNVNVTDIHLPEPDAPEPEPEPARVR